MSDPIFSAALIEPVKYTTGVEAGFIVFPHSEDQPLGWGEPYLDSNGQPIWPGTPSTAEEPAPNVNRGVGWHSGEGGWKLRRSPYWQVAGAIDWWGPWRDSKQTKRRVLSWNGPNGRYFNPGNFAYEGNYRNQEIYTDGKVLDIAPYPVLGAALTTWDKPKQDGTGTSPEMLLLVIVKNADTDEAYYKVVGQAMPYEALTDDIRTNLSKLQSDRNPNGWVLCGTFKAPGDALPADTPWFFSMDGTKARAMRRVTKDFTNEYGEEKSQTALIELLFIFRQDTKGCNFDYSDEDRKFTYSEFATKTQPLWTDAVADQYGLYHDWQEDVIEAYYRCTGRLKVAVDWSITDNNWRYAWFDVLSTRTNLQYWTTGVDDPLMNHSNHGSHTGKRYPPSSIPQPGDHTENAWFGVREACRLLMGTDEYNPTLAFTLGSGYASTKQFANTGNFNLSEDPYLYFWDSVDVFLHHFDLRSFLIVGRIRYDAIIIPQDGPQLGTMKYYHEILEWGAVDPTIPWGEESFFSRYTSAMGSTSSDFFSWTREAMEAAPPTYDLSWTVTDYQAERGTANDGGAIFLPTFHSYTHGGILSQNTENPHLLRFQVNDYFLHPTHCYRGGQYSSAENNTQLIAYTYHDDNTNTMQQANRLYPAGDLSAVCRGGTQFQGGGVL